jgi:hypothetical protein
VEFTPGSEEQRILDDIERYKPFRESDQVFASVFEDIVALRNGAKGRLLERLSECTGTESCKMG